MNEVTLPHTLNFAVSSMQEHYKIKTRGRKEASSCTESRTQEQKENLQYIIKRVRTNRSKLN